MEKGYIGLGYFSKQWSFIQFFFFIEDESSSDENADDVGDEKTTRQESSSNKDTGHDVDNYQLQNRSTFYPTGEIHLIAFYDV